MLFHPRGLDEEPGLTSGMNGFTDVDHYYSRPRYGPGTDRSASVTYFKSRRDDHEIRYPAFYRQAEWCQRPRFDHRRERDFDLSASNKLHERSGGRVASDWFIQSRTNDCRTGISSLCFDILISFEGKDGYCSAAPRRK
jgi:hypothetical protein